MLLHISIRILLVTLFLIMGLLPIMCQEVCYRQIGIKEGLPSTEVYSIMQDSKGYIWLSTDAGVCRFNGRNFTCFTTTDGLKDNTVFNLFEDRKGRIWMICYNGGICYYENGKINSIAASNSLIKNSKDGLHFIFSSVFDEADTLWLGTNNIPIKVPPTDNYKDIIADTSFVDSSQLVMRVFGNNKLMLSDYYHGQRNSKKKKYKEEKASFCIQSKGKYNFRIWTPFMRSINISPTHRSVQLKNGIVLISDNMDLYIYEPGKGIRVKSFSKMIVYIGQENNGDVWLGFSMGGAYKYAQSNIDAVPEKYFTDKSVSDVALDHEGGTWFSTLESGIYYVPMNNLGTYGNVAGLNEQISGLAAIGEKVFIANNSNQIFVLDISDSLERLANGGQNFATRSAEFYNYNGKIFVAGSNAGEIDILQKTIKYFINDAGLRISCLSMVALDRNSYFLLSGIQLYKLKDNRLKADLIVPSRALCMHSTGSRQIYIGTRGGLLKFTGNEFIRILPADSVFNQAITCIEEDEQESLLLGTKQNGVVVLKDGKYFAAGRSAGLPSDICNAILPDTNGTIWAGTNKGISLLKLGGDNKLTYVSTIDMSHGLPSNEITRLTRRGNILYAGTKEGLCSIDLTRPISNSIPPPIYISAISQAREHIDGSRSDFSHIENNFRFYIDCISFKDLFNPVYYFRLMGYDSTLQMSSSEFIEFGNLAPGTYTLEVTGMNNDGVLSSFPATFSFSIDNPFWLKWWFIAAEVLALIGFMFFFFQIRLKAIRKKVTEKANINTMIVESQMTALRAQMNPHFIFNAINSIQNYILKENTQQAYDYLAKFSKLIRMVLYNSRENMMTLDQDLATLKLYMELEQMRFDGTFTFAFDVDRDVDTTDCMIPGMLLQPFVENAIWHGIMPLEGKREGKVTVKVKSDTKSVTIFIEDNGIGRERSGQIKKSSGHKSVGMLLSKKRMELLSKSREDSKASILIEDLHDSNNLAAGTKVTITMPILSEDEN